MHQLAWPAPLVAIRRLNRLQPAQPPLVGYLFQQNSISATQLTIGWTAIFFFASAGASAAYLTVSEVFPMETRAMAIAFFYATATGIGGIIGPALYGHNIATGNRTTVFYGYLLGAGLMILGGITEIILGVNAEQAVVWAWRRSVAARSTVTSPFSTDVVTSQRPADARLNEP